MKEFKDYSILLVEDDKSSRNAMSRYLQRKGFQVTIAESGEIALKLLTPSIDIILSDLKMSPVDGMELLEKVKELYPEKPFLLFTAYGDIQIAVKAMKLGAEDFLTKPVDPDELMHKLRKVCVRYLKIENVENEEKTGINRQIVGRSEVLDDCLSKVNAIAKANCTVLITGESGTGKELVAKAIHQNSKRSHKSYIAFSAAELSENLVESELFGHKRGAFTGADRDYPGKFKMANGGTLFLDEIGEMEPGIQAKILRVLENREVTSLGDVNPVKLDVRIIFATNRDLLKEVEEKRFREDLYYRINVANIHLPPLRERQGDIEVLSNYFLNEFSDTYDKERITLSEDALETLNNYPWPGNIREFRNMLESIVIILGNNKITIADLPSRIKNFQGEILKGDKQISSGGFKIGMSMKEIEKEVIIRSLREYGGNRTHCAEILGLSVRTLQRKIKEYEIEL